MQPVKDKIFSRIFCAAMLVLLPLSSAAQSPEVSEGQHEYVVWLDPLDPVGNVLPLTLEHKTKYCSAAQEFARRTYDTTNGRHTIRKVTFVYDQTAPVGGYHIRWRRFHDTANAGFRINMYDSDKGCSGAWSTAGGQVIELANTCPAGLTCDNVSGRPRCIDASNDFVQRTATEWGWVLTHEAGHAYYDLRDEYLYPSNLPEDYLHICNNPLTNTSLMAHRERDHWCDSSTHLYQRWIKGFATTAGSDDVQVTEPTLQGYNVWSDAQSSWMDLQNYVIGEYNTNPAPAFSPAADLCVYTGALADATPVNDTLLVVDKSGSMGFKNSVSPLEPTALEAAFDAALAHYNAAELNSRNVGLLLFDTAVTEAIPYAPRTSTKTANQFTIAAGGLTDLCLAVSQGASRVRASGATNPRGAVVLLTDGRSTQPPCDNKAAVLSAVVDACLDSPSVEVWPIAFGNAEYDLIHQMSNACETQAMWIEKEMISTQENTYEIQAGLMRQGYRARSYQEVMFDRSATTTDHARSFAVPPGTGELEVAWVGEPFEWVDPDVGIRCRFDQLDFELLDPANNPQGFDPVTPGDEVTYHTRTRRILNPVAGTWTMRAKTGSNWFCLADNQNYTGYIPALTTIAQLRNASVYADVKLSNTVIARNQATTINAVLNSDSQTALTDINITAQLRHDGSFQNLTLRDDGTQGDADTGDGIYTGVFNECAAPLEPGAHRVLVSLQADANNATAVVAPSFDFGLTNRAAQPGSAISATLSEERALIVNNCLDKDEAARCGHPQPAPSETCKPSVVIPTQSGITLEPGQTVSGLEVCIYGVVLVAKGVRLGLGPGVTPGNIQTHYDPVADRTCITFDATAADNAPSNDINASVGFGGVVYTTDGSDPIIAVDASEKPWWSIHVGISDTAGFLGNNFDGGLALAIDYEIPMNPNFSWDLRFGYTTFDHKTGAGDLDVWDLSANGKYRLPISSSFWAQINGGLGLYYINHNDLEAGYNIGAGFGFAATPSMTFEVTVNHHETITAAPDIEFNKLMIGVLREF